MMIKIKLGNFYLEISLIKKNEIIEFKFDLI